MQNKSSAHAPGSHRNGDIPTLNGSVQKSLAQTSSTHALVSLLAAWDRRQIIHALGTFGATAPAAQSPLFDGTIEAALKRLGSRGRRKKTLTFGPEPAVGWFDAQYPAVLRHIPDPPLVLYLKGSVDLLLTPMVAVVGARRCTAQGRQFARQLGTDLSGAGVTVVSGMAEGIDAAAHNGAMDCGGGTVAVLGSGLAKMYPRHHAKMLDRMLENGGLVLSEYPHSTEPRAWQFPERNRIVSGLSSATVVVEAGERSGSLITARLALEQGRDVFAVPGPIGSGVSKGCHRLIQQGAGLLTSAEDLLQELGSIVPVADVVVAEAKTVPGSELSNTSRKLLGLFAGRMRSAEELVRQSGLAEAEVSAELALLELKGFVRREADGYIATP